ncbi:MAG TPA: NAD-dependent epimerase/dehydratase family protein [bacterium]|nr:NAD-dependent epimerase/dehydratase family protein [bacterium]
MKYFSPALITGASGFVGSHLAEALARAGVKVRLLVRKTSRLPFTITPQTQLCYGDVTDLDSVRRAVKGVKVVYHLAGILRGSNFERLKSVNAEGTRNVCQAVEEEAKGFRKFVFVSSLSAAGPAREGRPIEESDPCRPVSDYGRTKMMGEQIALSYRKKFPVTVLRPAAVYGPREADIFAYFKMVRQGAVFLPALRQKVSFIHVLDLVDAIVRAAHSPKAKGNVYFVSDGKSYTWEEFSSFAGRALGRSYFTFKVPLGIVKMVAIFGELGERLTGKATMLNLDKVQEAYYPMWVCSTRKIERELGFKPRFEISRGIEDAARFYRSAGWLKP